MKPGMVIYTETEEITGLFRIADFETEQLMTCKDMQSRREVEISIDALEEASVYAYVKDICATKPPCLTK
jgi:hypothetical protein